MFERFTERARQVVVLAQEEARSLQHDYIGTEHMLLGLLREEEGLAGRALHSQGITIENAREGVARIVGPGKEPSPSQMPFTPRAKEILERALEAALSLGHNHIGTEHLLLGVLGENEGVATRVLVDFGADPRKLREEVMGMLTAPGAGNVWVPRQGFGPHRPPGAPPGPPPGSKTWFQGIDRLIAQVEADIRQTLGREPDVGDLLLVLATAPGTLASDALRERGVDPDSLWATIERLRKEHERRAADLHTRLEEIRQLKDQAVEAGQLERAVELRDQERELRQQVGRNAVSPDALDEIRRRLGIPGPGPG